MVQFECTYCEKTINGVAIILDKTHFLHTECEKKYKAELEEAKEDESEILDEVED